MRSIKTLFVLIMSSFTAGALFTLTAAIDDSPLSSLPINAVGSAFWLGGEPATYCPLANQTQCPDSNSTVFAGMSALWVEVPGGQQIYVSVTGALGFTQAHSESTPPGAYIGGFVDVTLCDGSSGFSWRAPDNSTEGVLVCPTTSNGAVQYKVFANTPAFNETGCIEMEGLVPVDEVDEVDSGFGAWQ